MTSYIERLHERIRTTRTTALVGLDPRWNQLPTPIKEKALGLGGNTWTQRAAAYEEFCYRVIDVVAPLVPAVKPQSAFFEDCGPAGVQALANVIAYARKAGLIVICDAKRGDIGSTAEAYAAAYLAGASPESAPFAADALTVNPYMGLDTLESFVNRCLQVGGGLYVLVRTSNPGARDFQDRMTDEEFLYTAVAKQVEAISARHAGSSSYGPIGAVVGATYPEELNTLRQVMPHVPLLVPGYGSQGGTSQDVAGAFDPQGFGALVNSSRGILFAFQKGNTLRTLGKLAGKTQWTLPPAT